jgi:hypothetical protein
LAFFGRPGDWQDGEVKSNTDGPMFAKEGTIELACQGAALLAKVNGKGS